MKFLHLADLHLGKNLHTLSMIDSGDQPYYIDQLLTFIHDEKPDAVVIAGDVYDRAIPAKKAIPLLSRLLSGISDQGIPVMMVAGNHDGGERLEFAAELLQRENVYIAGSVQKEMLHVTRDFGDGFGPVTFWLMPFAYPASVRQALELPQEEELSGDTEAVRRLLSVQKIDPTVRNVLIAHQTILYAGAQPEHSDSETAVAGVGGIDTAVFQDFDYVALGHIHGFQRFSGGRICYAGSPLCYHFSEAGQKKGFLMVELREKAEAPQLQLRDFAPLHRVRQTMTGTLDKIIEAEKQSTARNEYVRVVLTDDWVAPNTFEQLTALFAGHDCRLLDLSREPAKKSTSTGAGKAGSTEALSLDEYFLEFYRKQNNEEDPKLNDLSLIRFAADQVMNGLEKDADAAAEALADFILKQEEVQGS